MKSPILLIALFIFCLVEPASGYAAEIEPVENHPMGCEYKLSGLVNNGDAEKINEVLRDNWSFEVASRGWKICLDSPGGSFVEGVKLAKNFAKHGIGTVVAENDLCESACAIAFLGGTYANPEGENGETSRTIHPTAKLGFHAPALLIPDGNYSKKEVYQAYGIALKAVAELSDMRARGFEIRESLFKAIITTPFEEMHYVDTVGKAFEYTIDVSDVIGISAADASDVANNICGNAGIVQDGYIAGVSYGFELFGRSVRSQSGFYEEANADCNISINENSFFVDFRYPDNVPFRETSLPFLASFASNTPLEAAFSGKTISAVEFEQKVRRSFEEASASDDENLQKSCFADGFLASIVNVQNFTNLRSQAGLNGQVIAQVPLGAKVQIVNPLVFQQGINDGCDIACFGSSQSAINACIGNNSVWVEVEYNGRRGFLSRKFLE